MTSFHERFFRKNRLGHFVPRGPKARRYSLFGLALVFALGGLGLFLLFNGHNLAGQVLLGGLAIGFVIYNGFVSTRSDL